MAARVLNAFASVPHSSVPHFAKDAHELRHVLATQSAEIEVLRQKLMNGQREVAQLQQRLRDAEGELAVAAEATTSATERLGSHAERHGLVLAASVERSGAERGTIEHELQRVEGLLHERDIEIRRLRKQAHELEAATHHHEMELKGLQVSHEDSSSRARQAAEGVSELMNKLRDQGGQFDTVGSTRGPSQEQVQRTEESASMLAQKQHDYTVLKQKAEGMSHEARRLETEEQHLRDRVTAFETEMRAKKEELEAHDARFLQEGNLLREYNEKLRKALHNEQRDAVGIDQRAVLQPQCGVEAEGVKREVRGLLETIPRLAATLRSRGQQVRSPEVVEDRVDGQLHAFLRGLDQAGVEMPPIFWRLSPNQYLIGDERVTVEEVNGQFQARDASGRSRTLASLLYLEAPGSSAAVYAPTSAAVGPRTVNC